MNRRSLPNFHETVRSPFVADDPRFLIVGFASILVFAFLIGRAIGLLVVLSYLTVLYLSAGLPRRRLAKGARSLGLFVLVIVGLNALLVAGRPLPGPLSLFSWEGLGAGIYYGLRVLVLYLSMTLFLSVASPEAVARGVAALLEPLSPSLGRRAAMHGFLAAGFLPLFADEIRRIRLAQGFRGGGFDGGLLRKLTGVRLLLVPLFVSAIHRSGQLAMAVELRGIKTQIGQLLGLAGPAHKDFVFAGVTLAVLVLAYSL